MKKPSRTLPFAAAFLLTPVRPCLRANERRCRRRSRRSVKYRRRDRRFRPYRQQCECHRLSDRRRRHGGYRNDGYRLRHSRHIRHRQHGSRYRDHRPGCNRQRGRQRRNRLTLPVRHDPGRRGRDSPLPAAIWFDSNRFHRDRCASLYHGAPGSIRRALTLRWKSAEHVLRQVTACAKLTLLTRSADSCHRHRLSSFSIPAWGA